MAFDVRSLIDLRRVSGLATSPDGTWLAVQVARRSAEHGERYVSDLWRVPLDGGLPSRITWGESDDTAPCFRADGALGFLSDRPTPSDPGEGGRSKRRQVWIATAWGEPRPITDEPLGVASFRFARQADRLVCAVPVLEDVPAERQREVADERAKRGPSVLAYDRHPVRFWDHWVPEVVEHLVAFAGDGSGRRDLDPTAGRTLYQTSWDLSADGRRLAFTRRRPGPHRLDDVLLEVWDLDRAERIRVLGDRGGVWNAGPVLDPTGERVACVQMLLVPGTCIRETLLVADVGTGDERILAEGWDHWPHPVAWDGDRVIVTADDRGRVPVFAISTDGAVTRLTPDEAGGCHEAVTLAGERIVGIRHTIVQPPEVFALPRSGGVPELLTALSGAVALADEVHVEERWVPTDDGERVQTFVVRPRGATGPVPTLLWIHGGPIGQFTDGWHWRWSPLCFTSQGYAVALPNPRGSTGRGQAFVAGIWGNTWGDRCYRDVLAVADALEPEADGMAAMGGSFGGYMTNWIGGSTTRFRCLVTHAGLFHLSGFHGTTDSPDWWGFQKGFTPYDDLEAHDRYSPHRRVGNWKTPTLVVHGEKDYRVPVSEALSLFTALRLHDVPSELVVFPDENHWILKPRNIEAWYDRISTFLGRWMR